MWGVLGHVVGAEHGHLYYAYDSLAYPDKPVELAARLQQVEGLKGVEGAAVGFFDGEKVLGVARTDKDGLASVRWLPPGEGNYVFEARVVEAPKSGPEDLLKLTPAPLRVAARRKETPFVVIDLDHTVVDSSFLRVLFTDAKPMAESVRVCKRIAEQYGIIYLTHRPDLLTVKSKTWLAEQDYPLGPLLVSQLKEAFGDSGKFKTGVLKSLRESYPNVKIGIGDKLSDAQAYVDNGLTAYLIPHYNPDKAKDVRKMAQELEWLRGGERLHVVSGWREVERGIFSGAKFPAKDFAQSLRRRAEQLDAERRARDREDDDD